MAASWRDAEIDGEIRTAGKPHRMVDGQPPGPVLFGEAIDADLTTEAATLEHDRLIHEGCKIDASRDDVGLDRERAAIRRVKPQIDAGKVAGCDRAPGKLGLWHDHAHFSLRIEKVHRRKAHDPVALERSEARR